MKFKRLSEREKHSNDNLWFKDNIRDFTAMSMEPDLEDSVQEGSRYTKMQINYDLYNNKINEADFFSIIYPYGKEAGKLPQTFTNKNIIFSKIRILEGMEIVRPFFYRLVAVNPEATTRKEEKKFGMLRDWVINEIMTMVKQEVFAQYEPQLKELEAQKETQSSEDIQLAYQQLQQQMSQDIEAKTPDEINTYMQRHHQDPAEILGNQILAYNMATLNIKDLFIKGISHAAKAAMEIFWVGEENEKPVMKVIHPLGFNFGKSATSDFIQDGDWASYTTYMSANEVAIKFGTEITDEEFNTLLENYDDSFLSFSDLNSINDAPDMHYSTQGIRVTHTEWKAPKAVNILTYMTEEGEVQKRLVQEDYKLDVEIGDLSLEKIWIPTKYEGYKLGSDLFKGLREVPGQHQDLTKLYECKLSYMGAIFDNGISFIDRMRGYQYLYDIILHKMENKIAQDKGKKMIIDQDLIDDELGTAKWLVAMDITGVGFTNKSTEGKEGLNNVSTGVKEIDFSLVSDIDSYRNWAAYIKQECGDSVGISSTLEGQIAERDAVQNVQQTIAQSTTVLQPFFNTHDRIKKDVLQEFIECAKTVYMKYQPDYLNYVLDDLSQFVIKMDYDLLDNTSFGLFVTDSNQTFNIMQQINPLLLRFAQSGQVKMSDIITVLKAQSLTEAQEALQTSERAQQKDAQALEQQKAQIEQQAAQAKLKEEQEMAALKHKFALEEIAAKGEIELAKARIDLTKQAILSSGFDTEKDRNENNVSDVVELTQKSQKEAAEIILKTRKQILDEKKFTHQQEVDKDKLELEKQKLNKKST